ncbi:major capsid protein [Ralstonia pickettii]|uniref:major capsid protein n=1 Tax=Ralstonia pickettii TaxID=329 RepID=UPI0015E1AEAE|nr:major capsid protein [Ralstonia pickettii]
MKLKLQQLRAVAARNAVKVGLAAGAVAVSGMAAAQTAGTGTPIDLSQVIAAIAVGVAAIATIGVAVLGVRASVATYSWVRQAIK